MQQYLVKSICSGKRSFSSLSNADWQSHGLDRRLQEHLAGQLSPRLQQLARDTAGSCRNSGGRCRREQGLADASCQGNGQRLETCLSHWELGNHGSRQGLAHGEEMRANGD